MTVEDEIILHKFFQKQISILKHEMEIPKYHMRIEAIYDCWPANVKEFVGNRIFKKENL